MFEVILRPIYNMYRRKESLTREPKPEQEDVRVLQAVARGQLVLDGGHPALDHVPGLCPEILPLKGDVTQRHL